MILLAVDTSGKDGSIALAQCGPDDSCDVLEVAPLVGGTFSAELVPQIAALLERHGFGKGDIGGFATASGPGSFTGLRIGLAVVKALAEVLVKPIAAVSLLQALAAQSPGKVLAVLDGGRNEVFLGEYEIADAGTRVISERRFGRDEWLGSSEGKTIVTADHAIAESAQAKGLRVIEVERPRSDAIARLGWKKIMSGEIVSPEALEADYTGRSDAELFVKGA